MQESDSDVNPAATALRIAIDRMEQGASGESALPAPQSGPQTEFLTSDADIVIYGGAAGGGKTFGLLLDMARPQFIANPAYGFVVFRRQSPQITNEGGLWDASQIYRTLGAYSRVGDHSWHFRSGASGRFAHLVNEDDKYSWQGTELPRIGFDELTHFTETQFFYLLSRNRSMSGIRPQVRATCNPHPGWVKRFLAPWVDKSYPDKAASGELRYFTRKDGKIEWVSGEWRDEEGHKPKSVTFVRSTIYDNKALLDVDPGYITNLKSLPAVERARLLDGDWDVFEGSFFAEWGSDAGHTIVPRYVGRLPAHWITFGGLDGGYGNPAFGLLAMDELGEMHAVQSFREHTITPSAMAGKVAACLSDWGIDRKKCMIASDPNMFHDNSRRDMIGEADIESFWRAGLRCVPANNDRDHGWNRLREWLQRPGGFHAWLGYNNDLIELFPQMLFDPNKPNDMLKEGMDDHLHDMLRYAVMTRPKPGVAPVPELTPEDRYEETNRKSQEHELASRNERMGLKRTVDAEGNVRWKSTGKKKGRPLGV